MKNVKTYIKNEIKGMTSFSHDLVNEATEKVLSLIQKNVELGKVKNLDQKTVDFLIFRVVEKYY